MDEQMLIKALNQAPVSEKQLVPQKRNELQRTKEWYISRLGNITGTDAEIILSGINTKKVNDLIMDKVWESLIDTDNNLFMTQMNAMTWGNQYEPEAIRSYEEMTKETVTDAPFHFNNKIKGSGSSVDGYVGNDGLIETKCPYNGINHIAALLYDEIKPEYVKQIQKQLFDTGRQWCDFVSFDPRMKKEYQTKIIRIFPDEKMHIEFRANIESIVMKIEEIKKQLK